MSYELNVESGYGQALWEALMAAGADVGITPYGTESMHVLRAEKGFVIVGQDTDGSMLWKMLGAHIGPVTAPAPAFGTIRIVPRPPSFLPARSKFKHRHWHW